MMTFTSSADLSRLQNTDPAQPVITKLVDGLFSETSHDVVALMEHGDIDPPLADLCSAEDVTLEGVLKQENMFLVVLQTDYGYGIVLAIPNEDWLTSELRLSIEENLYH